MRLWRGTAQKFNSSHTSQRRPSRVCPRCSPLSRLPPSRSSALMTWSYNPSNQRLRVTIVMDANGMWEARSVALCPPSRHLSRCRQGGRLLREGEGRRVDYVAAELCWLFVGRTRLIMRIAACPHPLSLFLDFSRHPSLFSSLISTNIPAVFSPYCVNTAHSSLP